MSVQQVSAELEKNAIGQPFERFLAACLLR